MANKPTQDSNADKSLPKTVDLTVINELKKNRSSMKAKLTHFANFMTLAESYTELSENHATELECRLNKIDILYSDFDKLQNQLEMLSDNPAEMYEYRETFEKSYYSLTASARTMISAYAHKAATSGAHRQGSEASFNDAHSGGTCVHKGFRPIQLPKINLPQFNGSYQNWLEYRDTFHSLIHNNEMLDNVSKFHYLRASLSGSAALIIKNIDFTSENYSTAWDLLCERYNNNRLLVNNHVQTLFNVDPIQKESSRSIRTLVDVTNKNIRALTLLKQPTEHWDTLIIYLMSNKLDSVTGREWEEHRNTLKDAPTLLEFCTFLSNRADLLETIEDSKQNKFVKPDVLKPKSFVVAHRSEGATKTYKTQLKCPLCSQDHFLFSCESFRALTVEQRNEKVKDFKVCLNCLRPWHPVYKCKLSHCKYCKERHSTLLHVEPLLDSVARSSNITLSANNSQITTAPHVLLSTALVKVVDSKGHRHTARALLDNGSTVNLITRELCGKLGLSRRDTNFNISGINNQNSSSTQSCNLVIESSYSDYRVNLECIVLPNITKALPSTNINISHLPMPSGLHLADPNFNVSSAIDILVGAEVFWSILCNNSIDLGKKQPKLYETKLGWLVSGYVPNVGRLSCHLSNDNKVDHDPDLSRFWELDTVSTMHCLSTEERACEQDFLLHTTRNNEGRFVVKMPLKTDPIVLGESYHMAKQRLISLERKFDKNPQFKEKYLNFMREYEQLGHMTEINSALLAHDQDTLTKCFLPHHGVLRESSTTTKLRTVFDASAVTSSGYSLNDIQMVGPTVQDDLLSILLRFRTHKYVVSGDIEKMYRAIELNTSQRSLQQILFRYDTREPIRIFTLNTVTYGTASAPYLATKCLVSLASEASDVAVKRSIQRDWYVDDYLSGGNTTEEVLKITKEVINIMSSAKFNVRKWKSNSQLILHELSDSIGENTKNVLDISQHTKNVSSKTLGLNWVCDSDILTFSINLEQQLQLNVTKRHILSVISQIFDPLGLVGPCIIEAKIIMQRLWTDKSGWDDVVPNDIKERWLSFVHTLPELNSLHIPRWVLFDEFEIVEIHIFTDASEIAYGSCVYIRTITKLGSVHVQLLASKNKVAPLKHTTIPRLELCGALLGARLYAKVLSSLTLKINNVHFWCDSTIVLGWLSMPSNQLKPFVRNRVNEIQENTSCHTWKYVPSRENPADLVSRGVKADLISAASLWWSGPSFLRHEPSKWPGMPNESGKQELPELVCHFSGNTSDESYMLTLFEKYSNFSRLQRVLAYVKRFIFNCRNKSTKTDGDLSYDEMQASLTLILQCAQRKMFPDEYIALKAGKPLPHKNRLNALSPFLDTNNIIRVGGRLDNSPYTFDTKHPILLCSKHHITKIIFKMYHIKLMHAGPQLLLANIRQTYWPLGGRCLSKQTAGKCVRCFRFRATNVQPIMGNLPTPRTELEFPFLNCSVDYGGPVLIADRKGRGCKLIKSWLCIFVCLSVKAVHLELVTDLTKEAFMASLNRFISRRGKPQSIWCDNGTTFVGTSNELAKFVVDSKLSSDIAQEGIKFYFSPAYSPHFNGISEAAVRSTKHHLKRILTTHLTYEEMSTCLAQIEAILNSRPLTPLSTDPNDFSALSPSHFLIGRTLTSVPHPQVSDQNILRLERFKRIEHIKQHFWNRFSNEYISLLQQRTKWHASTKSLKINTLVLIRDKTLPPLLWALGRIVKVYPGGDGIIRVAEIRTKRGTIRRAFNNICPLPIDEEEQI